MISGQVPNHLVIGARTGFLSAIKKQDFSYKLFTETFDMQSQDQVVTDLGSAPMPKDSSSGMTVQDFVERALTLKVTDWDITVHISHNAVKDDQTGKLDQQVRQAGRNYEKHKNKQAFEFLNSGDGTTFGVGYDEVAFFAATHVDAGAENQTAQDNVGALALSLDNFNTIWALAMTFKDDRGEFENYNYDLLVVHQTNRKMAAQIADNPQAEGTGNRDINPFQNEISYITSPEFDNNAWTLLATNEEIKPLIFADREAPNLQHAWLDPKKPQGGWFMFKFYARYAFHYGNWRLAYMGQT